MSAELAISPSGHLFFQTDGPSGDPPPELRASFEESRAAGLEALGGRWLREPLPPSLSFWRELARKFFVALSHAPRFGVEPADSLAHPSQGELAALVDSAPPMKGLEFLNAELLTQIWAELEARAREQIARTGNVANYLHAQNELWNAVGRVTFHLAENKRNSECPFAFLATYTGSVSAQGKVQHLPLGRALQEYAGAQNRAALSSLLAPVQAAAERSKLARELLDSRAIFNPQLWRPNQAYRFLQEIPALEQAGLSIRIPDWWKSGRPPRPRVRIRIGDDSVAGGISAGAILDFEMEMTLEGETLSAQELKEILTSNDGLAFIKGKWVEVDREKLQAVLDHWKRAKAQSAGDGVSLLEAMRLLSGYGPQSSDDRDDPASREAWSEVIAGKSLNTLLEQLREPIVTAESDPGAALQAQLRPYQRQGVHWLWFMNRLGLGACLADDMGLGKTIQVISLLLVLKRRSDRGDVPPSLLVVPASLLGNWKSELERFAPSLRVLFVHPSEASSESLVRLVKSPASALRTVDLVITTYSLLARHPWMKEVEWSLLVLDEAQAIKNPNARQTKAVKEPRARCRIALTGTPVENRLSDLWSMFDFINPGLLGGAKEFAAYLKNSDAGPGQFGPLRRLVRPYILRRLKTDKRIISDLPDKTELLAYCGLTRGQAALYQKGVDELGETLESVSGIQRRGLILAFLMRFKQICNHPSQWLGDGGYEPEKSGKFSRLREIAEEIASRQEKVLIFSQYREIADPLARFLQTIFGRPGLILTGETAVKHRKDLVADFQAPDGPPFFVLSLKAGGTGLNLTAASHVIHFDRWWNPAVENQATDRAFRIGQKKNVVVHKFCCRGTIEERIATMIVNKKALADEILSDGAEKLLTEMTDSELLGFVRLDINAAVGE